MAGDRLATTFCGIPLRNPVWAASGTFAYGLEFAPILDLNKLGGFVTKGLSAQPIAGNASPRLWHTEAGMMNSVGLQNVGVHAFIRDKLPKLRQYSVPVIANVFGYRPADYLAVIQALENADGLAAYELNVSCPNTEHGGQFFSADPVALQHLIGQIRPSVRRPLIVKLSPNVARIDLLAKAAEEAGADALSLVNTLVALAVDPVSRQTTIGHGFGGLSGSAIKPIALRMVYEAAQSVKIPVIGLGGISTGRDVAEFLLAGAHIVQVGTATFFDPLSPLRIPRELNSFLRQQSIPHIHHLIGALQFPGKPQECTIKP